MPSAHLEPALLYAELHRGNPGDIAHYVDVCAGVQDVLELGSGAGRIALRLAAEGLDVTALELDHGLAELARKRADAAPTSVRERIDWRQGDMREMDLRQSYDRILLPYNGLYCLGGEQEVLACFERVAEHLAPGGEFWLDVYVADSFHEEAPEEEGDEDPEPVARIEVAQQQLQVFEDTRWSRDARKLEVTYRFCDETGEVARQSLVHHYLLAPEIVLLLSEAGLEIRNCSGGFAGEPYDEDAELLVVGARRRR